MNRTTNQLTTLALLSCIAWTFLACDDGDREQDPVSDAAMEDVSGADANLDDTGDTSRDTSDEDASQGLPTTCQGSCNEHALDIQFGDETGAFEHAFYGLTAPEASGSGEWEVYLEASGGGASECPQEDSPSPDWTMIVAGLTVPLDAAPRTIADDALAVTFLDFDGRFLGGEPFVRAQSATVTPTAANLDLTLVAEGASDEDGLVALDLQASFAGGEISGSLIATHCASMDVPAP